MQQKDLPDEPALAYIAAHNTREHETVPRWDLEPIYPGVPGKLVLAKVRSLIKRGLITGCGCGCRGDLEIVKP